MLNLLLAMLFFLSATVLAAYDSEAINFSTAVNYALSSNPQITASSAKVKAAEAMVTSTRGRGGPKVFVEASYDRSNNPMSVFGYKLTQGNATFADFGLGQYTGPESLYIKPHDLDSPGYYNNFNHAVAITIPLFHGGGDFAATKQMQELLVSARHGNRQAKSELIYAVLQSYEGVLSSGELVLVAQDAKKSALKYLDMTKRLQQQSVTIESDRLMAEANLQSAIVALAVATSEHRNQLDSFLAIIGKSGTNLVPAHGVQLPQINGSTNELINRALSYNTKILALKSQINAAKSGVNTTHAQHLPTIDLHLRHDWNADTLKLAKPANGAMLRMRWQLFSSGEQLGATKHAQAMRDEAIANLDNLTINLRLAVIQTLRAIEIAKMQVDASEKVAHQMAKVVSDLTRRYGQGIVTLGQLLDAEMRLNGAKSQAIMARYHRLLAQAQLQILVDGLSSTLNIVNN